MLDVKMLLRDEEAERTGRWFDVMVQTQQAFTTLGGINIPRMAPLVGEDGKRVRLLLARYDRNPVRLAKEKELHAAWDKKVRANRPQDEGERNEILRKSLAGTVLMGWDGIGVDGEALPFSVEQAEKLLLGSDEIYEFVLRSSRDSNAFTQARVEEMKKKLQDELDGRSETDPSSNPISNASEKPTSEHSAQET